MPANEQKKMQKNRSHFTSSVKRPLFVQFDCSVNGCLNDRQVFFRAELQFVVDPLALFSVLRNQGGIEIPLHRQLANPYELKDNGHAGNRLLQFDIGKVARINADLFCQCLREIFRASLAAFTSEPKVSNPGQSSILAI